MLSVALAAASGLVWGIGDFAGGKAAQRANALWVTLYAKLTCLPFLAVYLVVLYAPVLPASLPWGAAAGLCGITSLVLFYAAMSRGAMTVVAPIAAVTSAVLPVVFGLAAGERPGAVRLIGVACALAAVALVSVGPRRRGAADVVTPRLIGMAVASGAGFGLFFICISRASAVGETGLWPILASQLTGLVAVGLIMLIRRPGGRPDRRSFGWTVLAGPFDMTANAMYLVATRSGDLSVVAPLAALYPVSTVILAMIVDREHVRRLQLAGLVLAVLALVLVSR